jgi:hypothetical protein
MPTQTDAFISSEANRLLVPGEEIVNWAYLAPAISSGSTIRGAVRAFADAANKSAAFAVITNHRLLLIQTRIGAFKPLLENIGVQSLERSAIRGAAVGKTMLIELNDGTMLEYQVSRSTSHVSTQRSFFAQVESLLGRSETAHGMLTSKNRAKLIATGIAFALVVGYFALKVLAR